MVERGGVKIFDLSKEEDRNKQNYACKVERRKRNENKHLLVQGRRMRRIRLNKHLFDLSKEEDRNKQEYAFALSKVEIRNKQE